MKKIVACVLPFLLLCNVSIAQDTTDYINQDYVSSVMHILANDSSRGRGNGSKDILTIADFIGNQFEKYGLSPIPGTPSFYWPFRLNDSDDNEKEILVCNGKKVSQEKFMYVRPSIRLFTPRNIEDFKVVKLDTFFSKESLNAIVDSVPLLIWTDKRQPVNRNYFPSGFTLHDVKHEIILLYTNEEPHSIVVSDNLKRVMNWGYNVIGYLPGKTKPDEVVIFSAHYDHLGMSSLNVQDNTYNGANDNASGTTALLALAKYFARVNDNDRSIMFCAFAGEENGLVGSADFAQRLIPEKVVTAINIEMIGIPQFGKNVVMITGKGYSEVPAILSQGLRKQNFKAFYKNDISKRLYERSDNYPMTLVGIPAHTIMGSDDDEPCYHDLCDNLSSIDFMYMTRVIKAIVAATETLIDGVITPGRIKVKRK